VRNKNARLKRISKFSSISFENIPTYLCANLFFFPLSLSSEERCEPSNPIYRNQGTNRNCPDLNNWDAFKNYEINDGLPTLDELKPNIKLPKLPTYDELGNKVYNKVTGSRKRAFFPANDD
jgi:hypothetical protein